MAKSSGGVRLRHLLILDFEATCDNTERIVPREESEVIELPTLLYDIEEDKVLATFHEYIRPIRHPTLTKFCIDLTGIEQPTVDASDPFPTVWQRYKEFLKTHKVFEEPDSVAYLTCGDWDLKTMLPRQLRLCGTGEFEQLFDSTTGALLAPFDRWINVKKSYQRFYGLKLAQGMDGMLRHAKMELEGRHHSGIDDCKNILRIVQRMRRDGWKPWEDVRPR